MTRQNSLLGVNWRDARYDSDPKPSEPPRSGEPKDYQIPDPPDLTEAILPRAPGANDWKVDPAAAFRAYDLHNPWIWTEFQRRANDLRRQGVKRFSARTIFEAIRWTRAMATGEDGFKVNNNAIPFYARKLMEQKRFVGFFEQRDRP